MLLHQIRDWTCAHCRAIAEQHVLHAAPEVEKVPLPDGHEKWQETGERIRAFVVCGNCRQPSMLVLQPAKGFFNDAGHFVQVIQNPAAHRKFLNRMRPLRDLFDKPNPLTTERMYWAVPANECGEVLNKIYTVKQQFPDSAIQRPDAEHLPADIDQELDELVQVLHVSPRLTTIACRRILEKACKTKLKNAFSPKKPLRELIDAALTALETTRQISDWAHQLRILGNEAVHESDEPITADEAQQAYDLTRLMLDLLFAYPVKIAALRNESV